MSELMTIGDVARRSGVAASALRFYEERGLITSERIGSGHRHYRRAVLRRIAPLRAETGRDSRASGRRASRSASRSSSGSSSA